ncbi:beta-fructofuranosidase [Microlunatus sagamiharensis]|uniref:beta-fructofuranosidase n=1 Tax=Microlunatus sagamiharensis TaxID=546874 RepID=A0A1H2N2M2_9ACTN|nr:glycoside hydrolase family 32 protein [Microlunatus sagamiharensis]SDU99026.1 beta-fructofuranosidase [Microlunatus sagamiharensis]
MLEPDPGPSFPRLHVRPRRGWLNDPNGLCRVDGTYHVFFQHNPYEPVHGHVHWGHVSSDDLLRWTEHPLALVPQPGTPDAAGCWSGCVTVDDGVPTAVFTAVPDHAWNAGALLARGDATLTRWTPGRSFVAGPPFLEGVEEVRDPFVFHVDGHRYVVQGAGSRHGRPSLLLWAADDLEAWTDLGSLLTDDDPVAAVVAEANLWECPNLVRLPVAGADEGEEHERWVLLVSLWRWVDEAHELAGVRYLVGDLQPDGPGLRFVAASGGVVDHGAAFYAPQVLPDGDRTLLWGWSWEVGRSEDQVRDAGWAGVLTFPRELVLDAAGTLVARPARELAELRRDPLALSGAPLGVAAFELRCTAAARLRLVDDGREVFGLDVGGSSDAPTTVLVDGSLVEVFRAGGTRTERAYPTATSGWFVDADPAALEGWVLGLG